ncbi:hypothetical protein Dvar_47660 [Desulfosarcina variabilis str. Montpellier]|uniref:hypothetical protein n=1 Tax=Desulfosarcina variabilis TaxID=2300 RepID=UPI003AFA4F0B
MTVNQSKYPPCFGDLETVFPLGEDGLRHSPESCMPCCYKTQCLRQAMAQKDGIKVREEMIDRAYASGVMGFLDRWSHKKALQAKKQKSK